MCFVLFGLLVDALQDLVGVGIDVKVHFFIVLFHKFLRIELELFIDFINGLIAGFTRNNVHNHLLTLSIFCGILDMDDGTGAAIVALQGLGDEGYGERDIKDLNWLEGGETGGWADGGYEDL